MDSYVKVMAAIGCLKDLGLTQRQIDDRIADWVKRAGYSSWRCSPPEAQEALANAMQKFFELEFKQNGIKQTQAAG